MGSPQNVTASLKRSFPFVSFLYSDIVVAPAYVELSEPLFARDFVNEFGYEWKWVTIWYGPCIKFSIVLNWSKFPILFFDEEESTCIRRFRASDSLQS